MHLLNGVFGTLCIGLFGDLGVAKAIAGVELKSAGLLTGGGAAQFLIQLEGVVVVGVFTFTVSSLVWWLLKVTIGIRVTPEVEELGLDLSEMGMEAYPDEFPRGVMMVAEGQSATAAAPVAAPAPRQAT